MADGYGAALYPYSGEAIADPASMVPIGRRLADWAAGTWPAQLARTVYGAATLPGDVATGRFATVPQQDMMLSDTDLARAQANGLNYLDRTADMAGLVGGGGYAAPAQRGATGMGIRAFHGSPHDFEKFDLAKIGTGEGAQAYGHGLYFAENPTVAGSYKLTGSNGTLSERIASQYLTDNNGDAVVAATKLREEAKRMGSNAHAKAADLLDANAKLPGHMYEVDINADPEAFLDWDKPLGQQSSHVQQALQNVQQRNIEAIDNRIADAQRDLEYARKMGLKDEASNEEWRIERLEERKAMPFGGSEAYHVLASSPGNPAGGVANMQNYASQQLQQAGIPGIKYLDQGSRGAGDGTRNYVVFDPSIIDIVRKYGWAGLAAGLGAGGFAGEPSGNRL